MPPESEDLLLHGLHALRERLGHTGMVEFLRQFRSDAPDAAHEVEAWAAAVLDEAPPQQPVGNMRERVKPKRGAPGASAPKIVFQPPPRHGPERKG